MVSAEPLVSSRTDKKHQVRRYPVPDIEQSINQDTLNKSKLNGRGDMAEVFHL